MAAKRNTLEQQIAKVPEELPVVECIGLAKTARGWVVVAISVQGDKVIGKEVISGAPEPRGIAMKRAMLEIAKEYAVAQGQA